MTTRDAVFCPECEEFVPHDRGYLVEHYVTKQRGELVTGKRMCDGSNTKPELNLKTVLFTGTCPSCLHHNRAELKEKFPGSLEQYGGIMTVNCQGCGPERDECSNCDSGLSKILWTAPDCPEGDDCYGTDDPSTQAQVRCLKCRTWYDCVDVERIVDPPLWVDDDNGALMCAGQLHQQVHRPQEDRPVLLTDNHVIKAHEGD